MSDPGLAAPTRRATRPILAAAASALLPGTGQWLAGARRRAATLLVIDLVVLALVVVVFLRDAATIARVALSPSQLAALMIVNILVLAYRVWAADDAYRIAARADRRTGSARTALLVGGLAVAIVLLTPHAVLGYLDLKWYATLDAVFGGNEVAASPIPSETTAPLANDPTGGDPSTTTTTTAPAAALDDVDRLNILLLGGDHGVGRTGIRTDTMITVSLDPRTGEAAMFQVPRNWTYAPLPPGMGIWDCDCYPELINELWAMGERHPDAFPGPGEPSENAVKGVVSEFLGIPIHYYALVNLDGFVDIIDALGGVEIYVPQRIVDDEFPTLDGGVTRLVIEPGLQSMDGELALAYARTRHQDSDYFRMSRQRCVLEAVVEQASPASLALNFPWFADIIRDAVMTDIPLEVLRELVVDTYGKIDQEAIVSIRFIPPDYHLRFRDDGKPGRIANIELVHDHVQLVIEDPDRAVIELGLGEREQCPEQPSN